MAAGKDDDGLGGNGITQEEGGDFVEWIQQAETSVDVMGAWTKAIEAAKKFTPPDYKAMTLFTDCLLYTSCMRAWITSQKVYHLGFCSTPVSYTHLRNAPGCLTTCDFGLPNSVPICGPPQCALGFVFGLAAFSSSLL